MVNPFKAFRSRVNSRSRLISMPESALPSIQGGSIPHMIPLIHQQVDTDAIIRPGNLRSECHDLPDKISSPNHTVGLSGSGMCPCWRSLEFVLVDWTSGPADSKQFPPSVFVD